MTIYSDIIPSGEWHRACMQSSVEPRARILVSPSRKERGSGDTPIVKLCRVAGKKSGNLSGC